MSRTEVDIASRVDITIMRDTALRAFPASYSEVCDTFRPRLACARRTDSGRERFIDFLVPGPVRSRFVAEHVSEGRPACIQDGLRQAGLGESGGVHIADRDVIELSNYARRELVVKVTAGIGDTRVDVRRLTSLASPLGGGELVGQLPQIPRVLDLRRLGGLGKTSKLTETSTFTRPLIKNMQTPMRIREPRLKERHFLPAARARMSVPEKR